MRRLISYSVSLLSQPPSLTSNFAHCVAVLTIISPTRLRIYMIKICHCGQETHINKFTTIVEVRYVCALRHTKHSHCAAKKANDGKIVSRSRVAYWKKQGNEDKFVLLIEEIHYPTTALYFLFHHFPCSSCQVFG